MTYSNESAWYTDTTGGGQIEPRPLEHLVEDLSPTVVVAELNHPPKNSVVRSEAEDRVAQHLIEECIRFRMIVLHDEVPGLRQIILTDMEIQTVFPVRMAKCLGRARGQELAWDEEVVSHRVRR